MYNGSSIVQATEGSVQDLTALTAGLGGLQNVLGAVQQAGVAYNTLANNAIVQQRLPGLQNALNNALPGSVRQGVGQVGGSIFP